MIQKANEILTEVRKAVSGKDRTLLWILTTILAGGHILLEDVPGVGKTTIALAFARALSLDYGRVQFTPDVLPSDITGYSIYDRNTNSLRYEPGAILCNLFLADELNRATSRTQSALLEAMEEGQVTVDGTTHPLPKPFVVFATQNPTGAAGTQLLPDSQMDRFSIRLSVGYPSEEAEREMVRQRLDGDPVRQIRPVVTRGELSAMQKEVASVYVKDEVIAYIVSLIAATRHDPRIARGASPRATLSVTALSRSVAGISGRDYVTPKDVGAVFERAVSHRLLLAPEAEAQGADARAVLRDILRHVPAPKL